MQGHAGLGASWAHGARGMPGWRGAGAQGARGMLGAASGDRLSALGARPRAAGGGSLRGSGPDGDTARGASGTAAGPAAHRSASSA